MKTLFTLCLMFVCAAVAVAEPVSVLNHGTPTPAPEVKPATAPTASGPALIAVPKRGGCPNGRCKLYSVEEQAHESTRHRAFGGQVTRKGTRTVVRPVR